MSFKVVQGREKGVAAIAFHRLLLAVGFHVNYQFRGFVKTRFTNYTSEFPVHSMTVSHMTSQAVQMKKHSATDAAFEAFLTEMGLHVRFQS